MLPLVLVLGSLALVGHAALWVGLVNRWHGTGFSRRVVKTTTLLLYGGFAMLPAWSAWRLFASRDSWTSFSESPGWPLTGYWALCAGVGLVQILVWARRSLVSRRPKDLVRLLDRSLVNVEQCLGYPPSRGVRTALLRRLPGNQLWQLEVTQHEVRIPNLPQELDGFSICHWSDLHFSGRIERGYFHEVVAATNRLSADVLALTGDICDHAPYIDWIGETLSAAEARAGKYFILGNHDLRTRDVARLRTAMAEAGFTDVGGEATLHPELPLLVAGNERPWFANVPLDGRLAVHESGVFRLLLSHSPDQFAWAQRHRFDLMLAGHTHGGQICVPGIGPVVCPSRHGTRYASGFFHRAPTLLYVSRGTASLFPVRLNCRPEVTKLVLRPAC